MQIEEDAESMRASDLVRQMKMEMGLLEPDAPAAPPVRPAIEIDEELPSSGDGRTLGRDRTSAER
jgi:phage shock protein A